MVTHSRSVYYSRESVNDVYTTLCNITNILLLIDPTFSDLRNVSNETDRNIFFPNYLQTS